MKLRRTLLAGLIALLLAGGVAVIAAFTPSVQRRILLRAAAGHPELHLEVEHVSAGLGSFAGRGIRLRRDGIAVEVAAIEGEFAVWPLVTGRRLALARLVARGVVVDAGQVPAAKANAGAAAAPAAAPGVVSRLELPMELVLGRCEIDGRALLPGPAGEAPVTAEFRIRGGGIAPGAAGALQLEARLVNGAAQPRVSELGARVDLQLTQSLRRTFDRVGLVAVVDGKGPAVPDSRQLKITAELATAATGESYVLAVETLHGGASERLATINAALPAGGDRFSGDWALNVRTAQVEPFFLGGQLPQFEARGAGAFSLAPATGAATWSGWLEASAHGLEAWQPALRPVGVIEVDAGFDVERTGSTIVLHRLDATVIGDRPVLEVHTSQPVRATMGEGSFAVAASTPGEVLRVKVPGLPLAWVRPLVHEVDISGGTLSGEIAVSSHGTDLTARSVAPLTVDALNVVHEGRALLLQGAVAADLEMSLGERGWRGRVANLILTTAAGDRVAGHLALEAAAGTAALRGTGTVEARLPALLEPWLGGLKTQARAEFDATLAAGKYTVATLQADVRTLAGGPLLTIASRRPFELSPGEHRLAAVDGKDGELLDLTLGRFDLRPLLGGYPTGLNGAITGGRFLLETTNGKWALRGTEPLTIAGFELEESGGRGGLGGLTIALQPRAGPADGTGLRLESGSVAVRLTDGTPLAELRGELVQSAAGTNATGNFTVELPVLSRLPAFATASALAQGRASGEMRAVVDGKGRQVEARVTLNGLVARDSGQPLPIANVSFRGVQDADGRATVEVPVLFDRLGTRSDLKFAATLARGGTGHRLDTSLTGEHASLDDILAVLGVFSATAASQQEPPRPAATAPVAGIVPPDPAPPWAHLAGRIALDIKSVTHGKEWTMGGLNGALTIEPAAVTLEKLEAAFGDKGRFAAKGGLRFAAGANPYALAGDFTLTEFDAGPLFRALEPGRPATVEGVFAVDGHLESSGPTVEATLERTRGQFQLTSRQGTFRGLKRGTEKLSVASKAVELGAALGSLFGSDKVKEAAEKVAGNAYFADQIAQELGELKYDQLALQLSRDDALNVKLTEISLISPEVRLVGKGSVTYVEGKPLLEQPLAVEAVIAGRGKLETLFGRARLLDGNRDELGYAKVKYPVVIGGTMAKPDAVSFYSRLAASKLLESFSGEN